MDKMAKERPMIFSTPMVRSILENRKTQTRQIISRLSGVGNIAEFGISDTNGYEYHFRDRRMSWNDVSSVYVLDRCPYGRIGQRLWVRETWRIWTSSKQPAGDVNDPEIYTASIKKLNDESIKSLPIEYKATSMDDGPWRPSIFMPRWASRILLEITDIRVERLQDISEEDAIAEGAIWTDNGPRAWADQKKSFDELNPINGWKEGWSHTGETRPERCLISARGSYINLWGSINGNGSWNANPWVWRIEFRRIS